jgi:hypothetical protein
VDVAKEAELILLKQEYLERKQAMRQVKQNNKEMNRRLKQIKKELK